MIAFVREVSAKADRWELPPVRSSPIDPKTARKQHATFVEVLKELGANIEFLPALPDIAHGFIVEDTAILLPELAVIARPGAKYSHVSEIETVVTTLAAYRPIQRIAAPANLDGGDVLRIGRTLYVGISGRTNAEAVPAIAETVEPFGYDVKPVEVRDCLHLKSACTFIPPNFIVVNPEWVDGKAFEDVEPIPVDECEPFAANTLTLSGTSLVGAAFKKTEHRLRQAGITTRRVDISELSKADVGLTGLALLLEPRTAPLLNVRAGMRVVQATATAQSNEFFSAAIVHGGLVYVSGQLPIDRTSGQPVDGDVEAQTEQVLQNLASVLAASRSSLSRVLRLTFYVPDLKTTKQIMEVCARVLDGHRPAGFVVPAKTLQHGCVIAADAIAAVLER